MAHLAHLPNPSRQQPLPYACPSQHIDEHSFSDEDSDSFDPSSLLPPSSIASPSARPLAPSNSSDEPYSNLGTFLNSNHDDPTLLRHLNQLAPSPATSFRSDHHSSLQHTARTSQSSSSSASGHDSLRTVGAWRMGISSERVPTTLLEETSRELRESEIDTDSSKLDGLALDEASVSSEDFSDEDKSGTIYAGHSPARERSALEQTSRRDHSTSILQQPSFRRNPDGLEARQRHNLAENIGHYNNSSHAPPASNLSLSDPSHHQDTQSHHLSNTSDGRARPNLDQTVDHSASFTTRSRASYFFDSARKYWLGSTTVATDDMSKLDESNGQPTPATTPMQASPADKQMPTHVTNRRSVVAQQRQTSARAPQSASSDVLPNSMDSTLSGNESELDPFTTILTNVNPSNEPSHPAYDSYSPDFTQPDMMTAPVDQTPIGFSARPSSAPPFNKTPSFISFDTFQTAGQPGPQSPDPTHLPNPSRPVRRPVQSTPASKLHYTQESPLPLPALTPSNSAPGSRGNPPWLASLVKTPSKLQFSFVPSSPSNTTFSGHNQSTVGAMDITHGSVTPGAKYGSPASTKFNSVGSGSPVVQRPASAPTATPRNIQLRREYERKFLHSPLSARGSPRSGGGSTSGEARILHQSHQTMGSIASHGLEGQSWSRLQDQTFSLLTPNQSFGMEFASPVGIRDWSIEYPSQEERETGQEPGGLGGLETDTGLELSTDREDETGSTHETGSTQRTSNESTQSTTDDDGQDDRLGERSQRGKVAVHTWQPDETVELSYTGMALVEDPYGQEAERRVVEHPARQLSTDASIFGPRPSRIAPPPHFSPLGIPQPRHPRADAKPPLESTFRAEDSPLAVRTHGARPGKRASCLADSVTAPRPMPPCPSLTTPFLEPWNRGDESDGRMGDSPEGRAAVSCAPTSPRVIAQDLHTRNDTTGRTVNFALGSPRCPPSPALSMAAEESVYYSPETSLVQDGQPQVQSDQGSGSTPKVLQQTEVEKVNVDAAVGGPRDVAGGEVEMDGGDRYRLMVSITENLKRDLAIKEQMIMLLSQEKSQALKACSQAQSKIGKMKEKVKVAAREQRRSRVEQREKIGKIVCKLKEEIEDVRKTRAGPKGEGEERGGGSGVERLMEGLEAIESLQPVLDGHFERTTTGVEEAEKMKQYELEISNLRAQLAVFQGQADPTDPFGRYESKAGADSQTRLIAFEATHAEHLKRAEAAQALSDGRVAQLEQTLEATAAQARAWQAKAGELDAQVALRSSEVGWRGSAEAQEMADRIGMLEEEARSRMEALGELRTQRRALEDRLKAATVALAGAEREHASALDELAGTRAEMETQAASSVARIGELEAQLAQRDAAACAGCEAREIKVVALSDERRRLQQKLGDLRAQSADREVEVMHLRKLRDQLKNDIQGLNIALEAKQQENALLKRERVIRQTGMSASSLDASTTRSVLSRSAVRRLSRPALPASAPAGAAGAETRPSLAPITNGMRRAGGTAEGAEKREKGWGSEGGSESGSRRRPSSAAAAAVVRHQSLSRARAEKLVGEARAPRGGSSSMMVSRGSK